MRSVVIDPPTALVLPEGIRRAPLYLCGGRVTHSRPGDAWQLNLADHLVVPGLINAHDHLHLNCIPPLLHAAPFPNSYEWIAAFQPYLHDPAVAAAAAVPSARRYYHGGLKNVLSGATTVVHHDPWHPALDSPAFPVRVLRKFGWSHSLGLGLPTERPARLPAYGPPVTESFRATSGQEPWIIHLAEGTDRVAASEIGKLEAAGCLASNTVLVHGVAMSQEDIGLVIERGAGVIWCPSSNLALLGRTLEPRRLFAAGRLALGSDSRLTGARDLLEELRVAAEHSDLTPRELLHLVTAHASRMLRVPCAGGLQAGQYADLLVLRDEGGDPYAQVLAASRRDLRAVVRGGVPVIADPEFVDWFEACGVDAAPVTLDGREKLLARTLLDAIEIEPGLAESRRAQ